MILTIVFITLTVIAALYLNHERNMNKIQKAIAHELINIIANHGELRSPEAQIYISQHMAQICRIAENFSFAFKSTVGNEVTASDTEEMLNWWGRMGFLSVLLGLELKKDFVSSFQDTYRNQTIMAEFSNIA